MNSLDQYAQDYVEGRLRWMKTSNSRFNAEMYINMLDATRMAREYSRFLIKDAIK